MVFKVHGLPHIRIQYPRNNNNYVQLVLVYAGADGKDCTKYFSLLKQELHTYLLGRSPAPYIIANLMVTKDSRKYKAWQIKKQSIDKINKIVDVAQPLNTKV
jgi:hypothetical protein